MILNRLKINDAKTEFIVFRLHLLKHDLSDLCVNVEGNLIKPSEKSESECKINIIDSIIIKQYTKVILR